MRAALDADQAKTVALIAIIVIVVIGILLVVVINKQVGRLIVAIVVIGLGVFLWYQRQAIQDHINRCDSKISVLGVDLNLSKSAEQHCAQLRNP